MKVLTKTDIGKARSMNQDSFLVSENKDNGLKNFEDKTVPTNRADLLWHGIGHVVYAGKQQEKVII